MKITANTKLANKGRLMRKGFKPYENMKLNLKKGALSMINVIKNEHSVGRNLLGKNMNSLGKKGQGYSDPYARWKERYLHRKNGGYTHVGYKYKGNLTVNLNLDGRFHDGLSLRFRGQTNKGQMAYSIVTVRPINNRYKNTTSSSKSYWKIVRHFETFDLSVKNRNFLYTNLSNGYPSIAKGLYSVK